MIQVCLQTCKETDFYNIEKISNKINFVKVGLKNNPVIKEKRNSSASVLSKDKITRSNRKIIK